MNQLNINKYMHMKKLLFLGAISCRGVSGCKESQNGSNGTACLRADMNAIGHMTSFSVILKTR